VKITLLFFLLITQGCGAPASWAARHTTVCLDTKVKAPIRCYSCNTAIIYTKIYTVDGECSAGEKFRVFRESNDNRETFTPGD